MKYFNLIMKTKIKLIPILFIILLIFMGSFYIISDNLKNTKIHLEIYFEEKNPKNNMISGLIRGTESTKNNLVLNISDDLDKSMEKLKKGDIDVLINVPKGFYESILNGENKRAIIYFSNSSTQISKGLFKSLSESSSDLLSSAQSNIYISDSIVDGNEEIRNFEMNKNFLNNALNREDNFKFEIIKSDKSFAYLYTVVLILSIVFLSLKNKAYLNLYSHLKVKGKKISIINFSQIISNSIILLIVSLIAIIFIKTDFKDNIIINTIKVFFICFFISSLIELSFAIFDEFSVFLILILSILSIFELGIILQRSNSLTVLLSPINLLISNNVMSWTIFLVYIILMYIMSNFAIERRLV